MISILYVIVGGATMALIALELYAVGWLVNLRADSNPPFVGVCIIGLGSQAILAGALFLFYVAGRAVVEITK